MAKIANNKKNIKKNVNIAQSPKANVKHINLQENKYLKYVIALLLAIFAFLIYSNTLDNKYALDDDVITLKNRFVQQGPSAIKDIFGNGFTVGFDNNNTGSYRPLVLANMAYEIHYFGNNPKAHHFFNILFYAISCLILFLLLRDLFANYHILLPTAMTLLYVAHPIHTEVVANIKSRDEILCFMFFITSLYTFFKAYAKSNYLLLLFSSLLYFGSILSKENAMTYWLVYPLLILMFNNEKINIKKIIVFSSAVLFAFLLYMYIRNSVLDVLHFKGKMEQINNSLMASDNPVEQFATAVYIMGKYLYQLLFPVTLTSDYSYNQIPIRGLGDIYVVISLLVYVGAVFYAIRYFLKDKAISFAILFFLITMVTVSNIFMKIGSTMAERFLFTPSLAFCIILPILMLRLLKIDIVILKLTTKSAIILIVFGFTIGFYTGKTIARNKDWYSNDTLFSKDVQKSTNSFRLHAQVASTFRANGEKEELKERKDSLFKLAINSYSKSLTIFPHQSEGWYNVGLCYHYINDTLNAKISYNNAINMSPKYKEAHNNLGVLYFSKADYDSAYIYFNNAYQADPNYADAIANLGAVFHNKGEYLKAIEFYDKSIIINPNNFNVYNNIIRIYEMYKRIAESKNNINEINDYTNKIETYKNKLAERNKKNHKPILGQDILFNPD